MASSRTSRRKPMIALVGRPNVGKSTLFNFILKQKKALVEDRPGVTRDRNYAVVERYSIPFIVIDTGGFAGPEQGEIASQVREQALLAIEEADIVFVLFDGSQGLQAADEELVTIARQREQGVYYLVNKCDSPEQESRKLEFFALGIDPIHDVSALRGRGIRELVEGALQSLPHYESLKASEKSRRENEKQVEFEALAEEEVIEHISGPELIEKELQPEEKPTFAPVYFEDELAVTKQEYLQAHRLVERSRVQTVQAEEAPEETEEEQDPIDCIRVAIIGRPNVGKSTLLNTLVGEGRAITSPIAGTTRDTLDVTITRDGQRYEIVDTAGLRRKSKIVDTVERFSTVKAIRALTSCDVAVMVIDADNGPVEQDARLMGLAHEEGRGIVIAVNKWDIVEKDHKTVHQFTQKVRETFKFAPYAPIVFISALSGKRCPRVVEAVRKVAYARQKRVSTGRLNEILKRAIKRNSLPIYRGRPVKLYYASQVSAAPPRFVLFFNQPKGVHFSNMRYLKNAIRSQVDFEGTDIKLMARKRQKEEV